MSLQHVKQRPILLSTPMVRAIIAGQKTHTRRIAKPANEIDTQWCPHFFDGKWHVYDEDGNCIKKVNCPYGQIGDQLWVRETYFPATNQQGSEIFVYKADQDDQWIADFAEEDNGGWKPSIFMPRIASRILLEITDIRVERLYDITPEDAVAEGIAPCQYPNIPEGFINSGKAHWFDYIQNKFCLASAKSSYFSLWEKINGRKSLESNPWVWVIEFKRIEVPA